MYTTRLQVYACYCSTVIPSDCIYLNARDNFINFSLSLGGGVRGTTTTSSGVGFRTFHTVFHIEKDE